MRVTVTNLTFGYDYRTVLKDISFRLNSGDFLAIVGNNGSGKSTLIKCILGINKIPPKRIMLDDVDSVAAEKLHKDLLKANGISY